MTWSSFSDFLAMGGYAFFVWMSYGVTALLVVAEIAWVGKQRRQSLARARVPRPHARPGRDAKGQGAKQEDRQAPALPAAAAGAQGRRPTAGRAHRAARRK